MGWLSTWQNRIEIAINGSLIDSALTHFPVMIRLSGQAGANKQDVTRVFDEVGAEDLKIAVTKSDGTTQIYVEVEKWDNTNEEAILWVSNSDWVIASGTDTTLYLYYDADQNDNTTYVGVPGSAAGEAVWAASWVMVQHMNDDPDTSHTVDSTSNDADGTKAAANEPIEVTGLVGEAQDFDGVDDYIEVAHDASQLLTTGGSIEAWIKPEQPEMTWGFIVDKSTDTIGGGGYVFLYDGWTGQLQCILNGGAFINSADVPRSMWCYVVATWDNTGHVTIYVNGSPSGTPGISADPTGITTTNALRIGNRSGATDRTFDGAIDEVRISNTELSAAFVKASYNACFDNLIFFKIIDGVRLKVLATSKARMKVIPRGE